MKRCPATCRKTAYLALIRSSLEYSSVVWDLLLQKDIDKLEKIQRRVARFITWDYSSRDQGCISRMLKDLALLLLQARRKANRLVFFYKVVEGKVPALLCHDYLTPVRNKRLIRFKKLSDCVSSNIIERQCTNNSRCFQTIQYHSELYKKILLSKHCYGLEPLRRKCCVCEDCYQLQDSCTPLGLTYSQLSLSRCAYAERPCNV